MPPQGRRPHLLYVAWGFPPCRSGGVYRALATANAFAAGGWDVTVLTIDRDLWARRTGADPALEQLVDPRIRVERIPFSWPALEDDLAAWPLRRVLAPRLWARVRAQLDRIPFPEKVYGPWRRELERAADRIHGEHPVDLVVATTNPQVAVTAAWHLHRRHRVPYVVDYRDAWTLDVFSGERLHGPRSRAARWEARTLAAAREIWFVNEPIRAWHQQVYPAAAARMQVVANGFDQPVHPPHGRPRTSDALRFTYVGTISAKVPVAELLAGWREARRADPALQDAQADLHGYLGFYGTADQRLARTLAEGEHEGLRYRGPVSRTRVAEVYADSDVLLLVLGKGRYVTSGKVFEYLSTGLPIVSVHDPGNAASDVLRGYPLWFPADDLSAPAVAAALTAAARAARAPDPAVAEACRAFAARYSRERQLAPRVQALREEVTR
ncbi:MAG TPA: glycosyltransferase [Angustibacter sp.]|nr:glycosyltransferase [Angustibacter sp.]